MNCDHDLAKHWYIEHNHREYGPYTTTQVQRAAEKGTIAPTTMVRLNDGDFVAAAHVSGLWPTVAEASDELQRLRNALAEPRQRSVPTPQTAALNLA